MSKKIFIYKNNKTYSIETYNTLVNILKEREYTIINEYTPDIDLAFCIGGDGTFLSFMHKCQFPTAPIIGVNTGHLGFFQEALPSELEKILDAYEEGNITIQVIKPIKANIITPKDTYNRIGINELLVRGPLSHTTHFSVSIDETQVQEFSGDGILLSTPVGSTAYNYSLGGSLVAPELDVIQLTPVAPMNTNAYRCFHSSVLLPAHKTVVFDKLDQNQGGSIILSFDGKTHEFSSVTKIEISQSENELHLVRFHDYDYWKKLTTKLL